MAKGNTAANKRDRYAAYAIELFGNVEEYARAGDLLRAKILFSSTKHGTVTFDIENRTDVKNAQAAAWATYKECGGK